MKTRRSFLPGIILTGLLLAGLMLLAFGCTLIEGKEQKYDTTSIDIAIDLPGQFSAKAALGTFSDVQFSAKAALGTFSDVQRVTIEVVGVDKYGNPPSSLATVDLVQAVPGGPWTGTITGLPVGPSLTFTARGYDSPPPTVGVLIFSGDVTQVLTGLSDSVTVAMNPIDDGIPIMFPRVLMISLPAEIVHLDSKDVNVSVQGTANEDMSYEFSSESGGGAFSPSIGVETLTAIGDGTITSNYTAPDAVGEYAQTVKVINSQGNSVEVDFDITVVYDVTDPGVGVLFAPVVVSLNGKRTGDTVEWTAVVEDDVDPLDVIYDWGFTPTGGTTGLDFVVDTANPASMTVYNENKTGDVTLAVTDGDGLTTTISFELVAGQFPDVIIQNP
jgi:hypothetical protein